MEIEMPGLHKVCRKLADGSERMHYYAWRGGPAITVPFGSVEFAQTFKALTADRQKPTHHAGTFQDFINRYQRAAAFTDLSKATRDGYVRRIRKIEKKFGDMPKAALNDPQVRSDFLDWRDQIAKAGRREADYCFAVLARIISWAHDRRLILQNPCARPGRLFSGERSDSIWSDDDFAALMKQAGVVALPCQIAIWTGQRQGDILAMTWTAYDGQTIRLTQSKTGKRVMIPAPAPLRAILDAAKKTRGASLTICNTTRGRPWTSDGFKTSFGKAKEKAGIKGLTFHDFRGTAVVRLARAGCTVPEIASFTGHSLRDAEEILSKHYLPRDFHLAESGVRKLEKHRSGTNAVNGACKRPENEA